MVLLNYMAPVLHSVMERDVPYVGKFVKELRAGDVDALMNRMRAFFGDISYELSDDTERHYQNVFYRFYPVGTIYRCRSAQLPRQGGYDG